MYIPAARRVFPVLPNLTPIAIAVLLAFPGQVGQANEPDANLPDLAAPRVNAGGDLRFFARANGFTLEERGTRSKIFLSPEVSHHTGFALGGGAAWLLGDHAALGTLFTLGGKKSELLVNLGWRMDGRHRLILTAGHLRQTHDIHFASGKEAVRVDQTSAGATWQYLLGSGLLRDYELNVYTASAPSRDLADRTYSTDSATLFELWSDPRRVAGGEITGVQGRVGFAPSQDSLLKLSLSNESLRWDLLAGRDTTRRFSAGAEWTQRLGGGWQFKAGADTSAAQNRYSLGLERSLASSDQSLGVNLIAIQGRDGAPNDKQIRLTWSASLGGRPTATTSASKAAVSLSHANPRDLFAENARTAARNDTSLLDEMARRPAWMPSQVVAKLDPTARVQRLVAVDKTTLPAGTSISADGVITVPLGLAVTGIASVTKNGAAFANAGQFVLSGNNIVINPHLITEPAVGAVDTYVVTVNNLGSGTTLITVKVSRGSIKIDSIVISPGDSDVTPPVTSAFSISAITSNGGTLSATLNEDGTGYYVVDLAANPAPSAVQVAAGQNSTGAAALQSGSGSMAAATPTSFTISGLAAATAYTVYFVARDRAGNLQAVPVSAALTTTEEHVPPVMSDVPDQSGNVGAPFSLALAAYVTQTNGDAILGYTLASGSLPPGLDLNTTTGVISGTPTAAGTYNVTVQAFDDDGNSNTDAITFVIAAAEDATPNAFDFFNLTNQPLNTVVTTNTITVEGINTPVTASTTVGTLVKNGTDTGASSTTVVNGDTLAVRLTTSGTYNTTINGTVTIGTGNTSTDNFSVHTMNISAPTGVKIFENSYLSWNSVSGANKYKVCWDAGAICHEISAPTTRYALSVEHDGKTFTVQSSADNGATWSVESTPVTYIWDNIIPHSPTWVVGVERANYFYPNRKIALTIGPSGIRKIRLISLGGGLISNVSVTGGEVTFDYYTPDDVGDTIRLVGTTGAGMQFVVEIDTPWIGDWLD